MVKEKDICRIPLLMGMVISVGGSLGGFNRSESFHLMFACIGIPLLAIGLTIAFYRPNVFYRLRDAAIISMFMTLGSVVLYCMRFTGAKPYSAILPLVFCFILLGVNVCILVKVKSLKASDLHKKETPL